MSVCLSVYLSVCGRWPAKRLGRSRHLAWGLMLIQGVFQSRGAAWRKPKKLLTEARKGLENRGPQGQDNSVRRTAEARRAETIESAAAWRKPIILLTEAGKGRENRGPQGRDNSVRRTVEAFGAAWRMLIKLLTEARKGRENRGPAETGTLNLRGQSRSGHIGTIWQGWTLREWTMQEWSNRQYG